MAKKYYAVKCGRKPGIYNSLAEAQEQTEWYECAEWKGFNNYQRAQEFLSPVPKLEGLTPAQSQAEFTLLALDLEIAKADVAMKTEALEAAKKHLQELEQALQQTQTNILAANSSKNGSKNSKSFYTCVNHIFDQEREARRFAKANPSQLIRTFPTVEKARRYLDEHTDYVFLFPPQKRGLHHVNSEGDIINEIYTDGACSRNGQRGASAGYGVYLGEDHEDNCSERLRGPIQTSQRAELTAINDAYYVCATKNDGRLYEIYTDSNYAIDCLTKLHVTWEQNGWLNSKGEPVANQDLIKCILAYRTQYTNCIGLKKVQAHGTSEGNRQADRLAREGIYASDPLENIQAYLGSIHQYN